LISRILEDAKEQSSAIVAEAKRSAEKLLEEKEQEAQKKAQKACQEIRRSAEADTENIVHRESVDAIIKARWIMLSEKRKIIDEVFMKVKDRLRAYAKEESYQKLLIHIIEEAAVAAGEGRLEVLVNESDSQRKLPLKELSAKVSSKLDVETTLKLSDKIINAIGGAVVQSEDGRTKIDNTLESILERERKNLEPKATAVLFSDESA
jgi:vacuolar-type H+-ATPase subunit E/Vma4